MVDSKEILGFLGLEKTNPKLVEYMKKKEINLDSELFFGNDEYRSYIERPELGFCLIFTDEAYFLGNGDIPIGSGDLFYSGIFFYSEGKDDYRQYKSTLPFGLSFDDTRENVVNKLGEQSWQRLARDGNRVISDRWDSLPDIPYRLHVTYDKETGKISIVSATIPDQPLI